MLKSRRALKYLLLMHQVAFQLSQLRLSPKSGIDNEYDIQKEVLQIETNSATEVAVKAVLSAQVQTNEPASVPASRQGEFVEVNTADNDVPPKATPVIEELSPAQEMLNLAQYRGKVVYLDFWASWCVPCQSTFPWMDTMQKKYPDDIVFVAVNFGENPEDTQEFLKRFPADIKFIYDPLVQIASEYGVPGLPYSFVYGRKGELLGKHAGFSGGSEINLEAALQNLFATGE